MKSMMEIVVALLLSLTVLSTLHTLVNGQSSPPPPVTHQDLQQVAGSLTMYVDQLPQMQRIFGYGTDLNGNAVPTTLTIGMYQKKWKFHRDLPNTTVFVYGTSSENATFPGPTIEARQGVPLNVTWENHLPSSHFLPWDDTVPVAATSYGGVPTVVHLHGSVHPPQSDGSALAWFTADFNETGPKWTHAIYTYPNVQPAGNVWYHDHALGYTRANLLAGLLGTYIIRKPSLDARLNLPQDAFDLQLVIADRTFNADGSLYMNATGIDPPTHPQWQPEFFGEAITVNGKVWPYLNVVRRRYRFRILNASNARYFRLSLSNGLNFYVVGSDASYLSQPITTPTLLMSPAEILDVVVDFAKSTVNQTEMLNDAPYPYPNGAVPGMYTSRVMKFFINPGTVDNSTIPTTVVNYTTVDVSNVTTTRYITLYEAVNADGHSTRLYLNGLRFEDPATETPKSGTTELWNVINLTGDNHPFHIHLGMMQTVKVQQLVDLDNFTSCMIMNNDTTACDLAGHETGTVMDIPPVDMTWKNTIKIEPGCVTSVVIKFRLVDTDSAYPFDPTVDPGYVYHCHILDHEDNAMIRPLLLTY